MIVETLTKALTALKSCRYVSDRHSEIYGQQEYTEMDVDEAIEAIESCFKFMQNKLDMNSDPVDAFNAGYEDARNSYQSEIAFAVEAAILSEREKQAEPVGVVTSKALDGVVQWKGWIPREGTKLYAAPVRTKDLSYDEILDVALSIEIEFTKDTDTFIQQLERIQVFARAVIAKFKEKNQ